MARNKKPRKKQVQNKLKSIKIVDDEGTFKLYKVWSSKSIAKEPFTITDNLEDLVEDYKDACRKYRIQPNMKRVLELLNSHQQKEVTHEEADFFKGNYN